MDDGRYAVWCDLHAQRSFYFGHIFFHTMFHTRAFSLDLCAPTTPQTHCTFLTNAARVKQARVIFAGCPEQNSECSARNTHSYMCCLRCAREQYVSWRDSRSICACMPYECVFIMSFVTYPLFISSSHLFGETCETRRMTKERCLITLCVKFCAILWIR